MLLLWPISSTDHNNNNKQLICSLSFKIIYFLELHELIFIHTKVCKLEAKNNVRKIRASQLRSLALTLTISVYISYVSYSVGFVISTFLQGVKLYTNSKWTYLIEITHLWATEPGFRSNAVMLANQHRQGIERLKG